MLILGSGRFHSFIFMDKEKASIFLKAAWRGTFIGDKRKDFLSKFAGSVVCIHLFL